LHPCTMHLSPSFPPKMLHYACGASCKTPRFPAENLLFALGKSVHSANTLLPISCFAPFVAASHPPSLSLHEATFASLFGKSPSCKIHAFPAENLLFALGKSVLRVTCTIHALFAPNRRPLAHFRACVNARANILLTKQVSCRGFCEHKKREGAVAPSLSLAHLAP
jgi:hypothetical protein